MKRFWTIWLLLGCVAFAQVQEARFELGGAWASTIFTTEDVVFARAGHTPLRMGATEDNGGGFIGYGRYLISKHHSVELMKHYADLEFTTGANLSARVVALSYLYTFNPVQFLPDSAIYVGLGYGAGSIDMHWKQDDVVQENKMSFEGTGAVLRFGWQGAVTKNLQAGLGYYSIYLGDLGDYITYGADRTKYTLSGAAVEAWFVNIGLRL